LTAERDELRVTTPTNAVFCHDIEIGNVISMTTARSMWCLFRGKGDGVGKILYNQEIVT